MTKEELMNLVGKKVTVYFKDGDETFGELKYADEFSAKHDYRKPDCFYINHISFKVSYVKNVELWLPAAAGGKTYENVTYSQRRVYNAN